MQPNTTPWRPRYTPGFNEYQIDGDTTSIFVTQRDGTLHEILIDTSDLPGIRSASQRVCVHRGGNASSRFYAKLSGGIKLHQFLMEPPDGMIVDHINRDSLDNRRANLRVVTQGDNMRNRRAWGASSVLGVARVGKRWTLQANFPTQAEAEMFSTMLEEAFGPRAFWPEVVRARLAEVGR